MSRHGVDVPRAVPTVHRSGLDEAQFMEVCMAKAADEDPDASDELRELRCEVSWIDYELSEKSPMAERDKLERAKQELEERLGEVASKATWRGFWTNAVNDRQKPVKMWRLDRHGEIVPAVADPAIKGVFIAQVARELSSTPGYISDYARQKAERAWKRAEIPDPTPEDDELVVFGDSVKALGDNKLGGYLVRFSGPDDPDLENDYFTKATDFGIASGATSPVYFNHRQPLKTEDGRVIRLDDQIGKGTLTIDSLGVLIDAIVFNRELYEAVINPMASKLAWSSGTAAHLTSREKRGGMYHVTRWPLGLDASVTPIPADYKNRVTIKALNALKKYVG